VHRCRLFLGSLPSRLTRFLLRVVIILGREVERIYDGRRLSPLDQLMAPYHVEGHALDIPNGHQQSATRLVIQPFDLPGTQNLGCPFKIFLALRFEGYTQKLGLLGLSDDVCQGQIPIAV
jgi:hypothetical protein